MSKTKTPRTKKNGTTKPTRDKPKRDAAFYVHFGKVWNDSDTIDAAAASLKMKRFQAQSLASRLRLKGVTNLKQYPRIRGASIDYKALNSALKG